MPRIESLDNLDAGLIIKMRHKRFMSLLSGIDPDSAISKIKVRQNILSSRLWLLSEIWSVVFMMISIFIVLIVFNLYIASQINNYNTVQRTIYLITTISFIAFCTYYPYYRQGKINNQLQELNEERKQQQIKKLSNPANQNPNGSKLDSFEQFIQINIKNLEEIYNISRRQSSITLNASLISLITGFLVIVFGFYLTDGQQSLVDLMTKLAGVLLEFIAGGFFVLYFRAQKQLKATHEKIIDVQNTIISMKIIHELKDEKEKEKQINILLANLGNSKK